MKTGSTMNPKLLFALALAGSISCSTLPAFGQTNAIVMGFFESLQYGASVYRCSVAKSEPSLSLSDRNIERGVVKLHVIQTLYGTNRPDLSLPYCFVRGICPSDCPIWPRLDAVGERDLLCVVVPNAEDPSAPTVPGINEAASRVYTVGDEKDAVAVGEVESICKLYDGQITPEFIQQLKMAVNSPLITLRDFALETTIMKLGKAKSDEALDIIRSRVADYREPAKHTKIARDPLDGSAFEFYTQHADRADIIEADQMLSEIGIGLLPVKAEKNYCTFLCRCLIALAQCESKTIREKAITTLADGISWYDSRPDLQFRPLDGLDTSERKALNAALDAESRSGDTNLLASIRSIRDRLGPIGVK
jgi:hypothetical protein